MDRSAERRLIRRAKRGDREAIEALVETHREPVVRFLVRLSRRPDVAEDIAQESFVRVLRHLDRFDERFRFSTWLYTIARRIWINHLQKCRPIPDTDVVGGRAVEPEGSHPVERREESERTRLLVDRALDVLPARQREVVELFHGRGLPVQEVAARLDMPLGTVKSHLFRARRRMGEFLAGEDGFLELAIDLELPREAIEAFVMDDCLGGPAAMGRRSIVEASS